MMNFFKQKKPAQIASEVPLSETPLIDDAKIQNIAANFYSKDFMQATKPVPESESSFLEIKIISSDETSQEIEISYGKSGKKKKIRRKIFKNFLPANLANNLPEQPSKSLGATHLNLLNQQQSTDNLVFKEKLLNALAKINILTESTKTKGSPEINYQKIWDGEARINIDAKFSAMSPSQKQQAFDQESLKRENYLNTSEKAILVAAINNLRGADEKIDRAIISQPFNEIVHLGAFQGFVKETLSLVENKEKLLDKFFKNLSKHPTPEKTKNLINSLNKIFRESDKSKRHKAIKTFKALTDQQSTTQISK